MTFAPSTRGIGPHRATFMSIKSLRQLSDDRLYSDEFSSLLSGVFERGDQCSVGHALKISQQIVYEWLTGQRRSPFEAAAVVIEQLRRNGNARSDAPFLALARRLGYIAYRHEERLDDAEFAELLREFSEVVDERARAEQDGRITRSERLAIAERVSELIDCAAQYRDDQLARANAGQIHREARG